MPTPYVFQTQVGLNRDFGWYPNPKGSFYRLNNMRLTPGNNHLEQTPHFYSQSAWSAGSYYNGGTITESSTNPASLTLFKNSVLYNISSETAHANSTQMQVFRQTVTPAATNLNTHCFVQVNSTSGFAITLGSTFDIVIDAATTFKWRKNGGAYTTGVAITTTGVSIDSGNATVYFLTASGFTNGDTWTWTRTDRLQDSQVQMQRTFYDWSYAVVNTTFANFQVFFPDNTGRIMVLDSLSGCIMTAGYRPLYGTHVMIYYNHLFVLTFSTGQAGDTTLGKLTNRYGNSDLGDLNNFFPTDTNEADAGTLQPNTIPENYEAATGGFGWSVINGILFAYTSTRIWSTSYEGLPTPFSFQEFRTIQVGTNFAKPVKTPNGDYFMTTGGLCLFDGNNVTPVTNEICELVERAATLNNIVWGGYNNDRKEAYFFCNSSSDDPGTAGFWVLQEVTNSWYFRTASFTNLPNTMLVAAGLLYLPKGLGFLTEDAAGSQNSLVNDYNAGASLALPTIETCDMVFNNIQQVVDLESAYLDAFYVASPAGTAYGATGVTLEVSTRTYASATVTYPGGNQIATWTTASTDGTLSIRAAGRLWRFRIRPTVANGKACFGFEFNSLVMNITGGNEDDLVR